MTFNELRNAGFKNPTVVLFWGLNCSPCERLKPQLRETCEKMGVRLEEYRADTEMDVMRELKLRSVPSVAVVYPAGNVQVAFTGLVPNIRQKLLDAGVVEH